MAEALRGVARKKAVKDVVKTVGSLSENGMVKNDAALYISNLLGEKTAKMLGETLEELKLDPQQYSLVFKDKGLRLKAVSAIAEKARVTDFPTEPAEVFSEFENYMNYCDTFMISPTLGLYAAWLGVNINDFETRLRHYKTARPSAAAALEVTKELLRSFLETKALDGDIAPAVYLHQNKAYFDAVETSTVRHETVSDAHIRDSSQIAEVIDMLPEEIKVKVN